MDRPAVALARRKCSRYKDLGTQLSQEANGYKATRLTTMNNWACVNMHFCSLALPSHNLVPKAIVVTQYIASWTLATVPH
jgi:hypothetical protein